MINRVQQRPVSVLIVDDLAAFRRAAVAVINATEGFEIIGEAGSGESALEILRQQPASLVVMDVHMPGIGGMRAAVEMRRTFPTVEVVLVSIDRRADLPPGLPESGARYCPKDQFSATTLQRLWASRDSRPDG